MVTVKFLGKHHGPVWYHTQGRTKYAFGKNRPLREVSEQDAERLIKNYPGKFEISRAKVAEAKPAEAKKTVKKDGDK